jgi:hypothetical protein
MERTGLRLGPEVGGSPTTGHDELQRVYGSRQETKGEQDRPAQELLTPQR